MGRIKTKRIKRVTHKLIEENKGKFKDDFNNNKELVNESASIPSKR